jgi:hypothetical protein
MNTCPSDFALDDLELHGGAGSADLTAHLVGCGRCATRLRERARLREDYQPLPAARLLAAARESERQQTSRRRWRLSFGLPLTLAGACALVFMVLRTSAPLPAPSQVVVLPKGAYGLDVFFRRGGEISVLAPGQAIAPRDELRFRVRAVPKDVGYITLGSIDGRGSFSPFYPASLDAMALALPAAGDPLPGAITLDDQPGPERLFFVMSPSPLRAADVARFAESSAAATAPATSIAGVPVHSGWLVLPKLPSAGSAP